MATEGHCVEVQVCRLGQVRWIGVNEGRVGTVRGNVCEQVYSVTSINR